MTSSVSSDDRLQRLFQHPDASKRIIDKLIGERSLYGYMETMWPVLEPAEPFVGGWVPETICEHLEAVSNGQIRRLLVNVPPGCTKSMTTSVFWPTWEWGPKNKPSIRYMLFSYSGDLTLRDNDRAKQLMQSPEYQGLWGDRFRILNTAIPEYHNDHKGWRLASSVGAKTTGFRANRLILDDPHNVKDGESEVKRRGAVRWFRESLSTRMNNMEVDTVVVIMQRVHENDVSGEILANNMGYEHLMIPMEYDIGRHCVTVLGWQDPRGCDDETGEKLPDGDELAERDGELCWPERFSPKSVLQLKADLGPYATAGQLQQQPSVRGGAIFVEDWWQEWPTASMRDALETKYFADGAENRTITPSYPELDRVIASLDTALGEKETNDFNAITVWGVFRAATSDIVDPRKNLIQGADGVMRIIDSEHSKLMLMYAWQRRLPLHGEPEDMPPGMTPQEWNAPKSIAQRQKKWGLVEWTVYLCRRYRVSTLLIENKTRGHDVRNEIFRLFKNEDFGVVMMEPLGDKVQRANALVHLWSNQVVYAPLIFQDGGWGKPAWCATAIDQFTIFPRGTNDDIVDSGLHAIKHLRDTGFALRTNESEENYIEEAMHRSARRAELPYDV